RLQLGGEGNSPVPRMDVQRLYAEPIADEMKAGLASIPERDGEHPDKSLDGCRNAVTLECREYHLGIRVPAKSTSLRFEFGSKGAMIENFAIENNHIPPSDGRHRLPPQLGQINDGQSPEANGKAVRRIAPEPLVI